MTQRLAPARLGVSDGGASGDQGPCCATVPVSIKKEVGFAIDVAKVIGPAGAPRQFRCRTHARAD